LNQLPSMTPDPIINFDFTTDFTLKLGTLAVPTISSNAS